MYRDAVDGRPAAAHRDAVSVLADRQARQADLPGALPHEPGGGGCRQALHRAVNKPMRRFGRKGAGAASRDRPKCRLSPAHALEPWAGMLVNAMSRGYTAQKSRSDTEKKGHTAVSSLPTRRPGLFVVPQRPAFRCRPPPVGARRSSAAALNRGGTTRSSSLSLSTVGGSRRRHPCRSAPGQARQSMQARALR